MQREFRDGGADGEHADRYATASEIGIERERADDHVERKHRAEAVTDDHDFIHRAGADARHERLRESIEPRLGVGTAAEKIVAGEYPVVEQLLHAPAPSRPAQQDEEDRKPAHDAGQRGNKPGQVRASRSAAAPQTSRQRRTARSASNGNRKKIA